LPGASAEPPLTIAPLGPQHDRAGFSCGIEALDTYLRERARQDARKRIAAPFVLTAGENPKVIGYYTLSAISIVLDEFPQEIVRKLPRYPAIPATLLGRLAVDAAHRGEGLGEHLLMDALYRAWTHATTIASFAVVVDAINEEAASFYARYEFRPFPHQARRLFLPMQKITPLFSQ
jgi:GNAT superfamily N-acetyltransferase